MTIKIASGDVDVSRLWETIRAQLKEKGIDLNASCCGGRDGAKVKVVCVAPDLEACVAEMGQAARDQVVMVRVDEPTIKALDAWVDTGVFKSRSEAAALFIREGLKVRQAELDQLRDALKQVEQAKERLHAKAREVLGGPG